MNHSRISNLFLLPRPKFTTRRFFNILVLTRTGGLLSLSLFLLNLLLMRGCHVIPHSVVIAWTVLALMVLSLHLTMLMLANLPVIGLASTLQRVDAPQPFPLMTFRVESAGGSTAVKRVQALQSLCPQTWLLPTTAA